MRMRQHAPWKARAGATRMRPRLRAAALCASTATGGGAGTASRLVLEAVGQVAVCRTGDRQCPPAIRSFAPDGKDSLLPLGNRGLLIGVCIASFSADLSCRHGFTLFSKLITCSATARGTR